MRHGTAAHSDLELDVGGVKPERLAFVGQALAGTIYRSREGGALYRVLPIGQAPLRDRQTVESWKGRQMVGMATIEDADNPPGLYWIRYRAGAGRTMADVLQQGDTRERVLNAARMVAAFDAWSTAPGPGPIPMPAEMALDGATAMLLGMPYWPRLDVGHVLAEPERAAYLAPEVVRGVTDLPEQAAAAGRYAIAQMVLRCFSEAQSALAGVLLARVANGSAPPPPMRSALPAWVARMASTQQVIDVAHALAARDQAARLAVDTAHIARLLRELEAKLSPINAVTELRDAGSPAEAFELLQDVLLEDESYELVMLGAEIALELDLPLHAIDLLERAREREERPEPYKRQLEVLVTILADSRLEDAFVAQQGSHDGTGPSARGARTTAPTFEGRMLRDYGKLVPEHRAPFQEAIAAILVERGSYKAAAAFIRPLLFDDAGKYLWWRFGLQIPYVGALLGLGGAENEAAADTLMTNVKAGLNRVRTTMDPWDVQRHGAALTELEISRAERRPTS